MLTRHKRLLGGIRELLCSLRLTIFLFISIALVSIVGTLLPQGQLPPSYLEQISPLRLQIYSRLGFFDMYHSWWFTSLLSLFSLNLIFCSVKRLPHVLRYITAPAYLLDPGYGSSLSLMREIRFDSDRHSAVQKLTELLQGRFGKVVITENGGETHLFSQRHQWCRLGVYLVHASILLIFSGAIIGSLFGFSGYASIVEGGTVGTVETDSGKKLSLGFDLRCEKFSVDYYPNGTPKEFRSIVTVLEGGRPVPGYQDVKVIVNQPLSYRGITFYQSGYGSSGRYFFGISVKPGMDESALTADREGTTLPDGSVMRVLETTDDVSRFDDRLSGPAAVVELVSPKGYAGRFISYARHPEQNLRYSQNHKGIPVVHYRGEQKYTGLKVTRDPGVWFVWGGCFLMMCGLFTAFLFSHKRIWIVVNNSHAAMYGNANKNQAAFGLEFADLAGKIKDSLQDRDKNDVLSV